jgi:lipoprotein NlpD
MRPYLPNESCAAFRRARTLAIVVAAVVLAACATSRPAPVEDRVANAPSPPPAVAAETVPAPVVVTEPDARALAYTVKRGDTLAQIALDNGLDYRELAAWNSLENPNVIRVGQVLRLAAPAAGPATVAGAAATTPLRQVPLPTDARPGTAASPPAIAGAPPSRGEAIKSSPKALREPYSEHAVRDITLASNAAPPVPVAASVAPAPPERLATGGDTLAMATPGGARAESRAEPRGTSPSPDTGDDDRLDWAWPVKGKIVGGFSESSNLKGIDIAGAAGQPVLASAPGKVVYAGSGLRGYGKLIIIKHNKTYLSAYAHNRELLVKEGDQVSKGQKIAEMGNTDADQVKLHFEIRRMGKPMDPARYLPPA